ncbi:alpha-L-rhamnosidase [Flavobacterium akiainvivens]|uniref:alpha-L-rhamnosidase n=1 Tax=Flavobacterium akiainvivens TaxID=1202724 RepID=A0A0M8MLG5_9FLAO|nr:glycoside hydrolase family 78 protein [Flavobacterium akiainvivens]KOS08227.1 alpha-L-rhamnosidase [Flavobacterium akiainvivens]SFQ35746.1 alpha-L-rhamnosidase [Flavobacterium akiainvivens]
MKKLLLLALILSSALLTAQKITGLVTEGLTNPLGIDTPQPHFSWKLESDKRNVMQSAYEIKVTTDEAGLKSKVLWTSGKVTSDQSLYVPYGGSALASGQRYYWQVRVWDNKGKASGWSTPAYWQMGLLKEADWKAQWISPGYEEDPLRACPLMRKEFSIGKKVKSATAYITAHGLYEAQINGKKIGDAYLTPGWTSYSKRLQYQVYDVTGMFKQGSNAIGVTLGNGWYRGLFSLGIRKDIYGSDISLLMQVNVEYTDGTTETLVSDNSWKSSTGSILSSEIYGGETIDARKEKTGWALPGYNTAGWVGVKTQSFPKNTLIATYNEPITKHETFTPVKILTTPKGEQVIDFGQNLVGWVVVKVNGKAGDTFSISHSEVLDKEGNFYTESLRGAKAQDTYILKGGATETFEPHFTWHGFRYIKIEGYPGTLKPENFTAVVLYSDMEMTGSFTSSNELINQLQHNIEWGLRGNFLDVPTDCPQRDERLGWTGDAQVFFRTASFLRGVNNFFTKWMKDVQADQYPDGAVPYVVPNTLMDWDKGSAGWGDVATIIPWDMYVAYGDKRILENQYGSMKAWVGFIQSQSTNDLWNKGNHFGDWLFYSVNDDRDGSSAITNKYFITQCFYAHSVQLLINAAQVLGKTDDVATYTTLLGRVKNAFLKEYITPNGSTVSDTQTSYVLALQFDMLPENLRAQAAERLVANIRRYNNHLTTGFLGTPYLCHVLSRFGHANVAYDLLLQKTYPSWLYPVTKGATTIWERWDGIKTDGTFQTPDMNSYNHYAYGAIGDWMYRVMVGIDVEGDGVGYKKIQIKPLPGGDFTHASADYETPYGKVASGWKIEGNTLTLTAVVPANTTAVVCVPAAAINGITEGGKAISTSKDVEVLGVENKYVKVKVGSGSYVFTAPYQK